MIVSLILWGLIKRFKKKDEDYEKIILLWITGIFFSLSSIMFFYLKFFIKDTTEERILNVFRSPNSLVVEGFISDFERKEQVKKMATITIESFTVDSVEFSYSNVLLGQFNHFSKTKNGVFRDGLPVRITYAKESHEILKVQLQR
ncbi:hypothetical protein ACWA1F_02195 [Flavobacterium sp. 3-218]